MNAVQPEIVKVDAHYREASEPGLLLVVFVLVQANPPAEVTWVDQDGQVTVNASRFLLLDAQPYPGLANHTVRVQLHSPPRNASLRASNDLGEASSSVPLPGLLATQLELPLVALVGAAAVALVILLSFGVLISWTVSQVAKKSAGRCLFSLVWVCFLAGSLTLSFLFFFRTWASSRACPEQCPTAEGSLPATGKQIPPFQPATQRLCTRTKK
uniref:Transmembrane protein 25 n=1 Tax=Pseudonaja textilis TaxID=8673 RepID=A0A670Y524_PSETE